MQLRMRYSVMCITLVISWIWFDRLLPAYAGNGNLVLNPSFESKQGWEDWGGFERTEASKNSGRFAAAVNKYDGGAGRIIEGITAGKTFTLSGYGRVNQIGQEGILGVECLDQNGEKLQGGRVTLTFKTTAFTHKSVNITTVPGTTKIQVYVYVYHAVKNGVSYFDDISLVPSPCTLNCHTSNAAFLPHDWFAEPQPSKDIAARVKQLREKKIIYQMADIGLVNEEGELDPSNYAGLAQWIKVSKEIAPDQLIIVAINFNKRLLITESGEKQPNQRFGTIEFNRNLIQLVRTVLYDGVYAGGVAYRADGVHIDFEDFLPDDEVLANTLRSLREHALPEDRHFSVSAPVNYAKDKLWSQSYIRQIASIVNQINPMVYDQMGWDSPIDSPYAYQNLWRSEIKRYSDAIGNPQANGQKVQLVPIMPSYERRVIESNRMIYHDPYVESIYSASKGLISAINDGADVHGAGIFWWATFIGNYPELYPSSYYLLDQENWLEHWVNAS